MDANTLTGRRRDGELGSEECYVLGAFGRDTPNNNGGRLSLFSIVNNRELTLLNMFSSTAKNSTSHTLHGRSKTGINYTLTRQRERKLLRDVNVHLQPSFLPISDHNIVTCTLNNNGGRLSLVSTVYNCKLTLLNTFSSTAKNSTSHSSTGEAKHVSTTPSRDSDRENSRGTLLYTPSRRSYSSRTTISSQNM